jgi:hypothetical protein
MRKAKIALTAVGVLAIVGGALAFKAARTTHTFFTNGVGNVCTTTTAILFSTTDLVGDQETEFVAGVGRVANSQAPCPGLNLYPAP